MPRYAAIAAIGVVFSFLFLTLLPFIMGGGFFFSSYFSFAEKISKLGGLLADEAANFATAVFAMKALTSLLFGITMALIVRYFTLYRATLVSAASTGALALFASLIGIGCASCGVLFVGTFASLASLSALFLALPLRGLEFGIAGIFLLIITIIFLLRRLPSV